MSIWRREPWIEEINKRVANLTRTPVGYQEAVQVLRYKPERWWFEFPMIAYKITVVTASTLMDSEAKAKLSSILE